MNKNPNYAGYSIWSLDFIRAMNERPTLIKYLLRLILGKYAYREFVGLVEAFEKDGWYDPFMCYGCEGVDYHKDKKPLRWWAREE